MNKIAEIKSLRRLLRDQNACLETEGVLSEAVRFIERNQILEVGQWKQFVEVFRRADDGKGVMWTSWRGEFWGKMMRGAAMTVAHTRDCQMYRVLEASVREILTVQDDLGRISGYDVDTEFTSWDMWERKYVMLGMMYFLEICQDAKLGEEIVSSLTRQADYILAHVGPNGMDIRTTSAHWEGLNSCSILEPMVRLYRLTAEGRYLDFAEYIVSTGFALSENLIELAYEDVKAPHEYPVVKAYEMMSCFEGLLQYYCVTGIEKYKDAVLRFGQRILNGELSVIGCCGCTHELFDHTAVRQTQTDWKGVVQEHCVTVTWMKLAEALLELSGDVRYADSIENSFYNAYLGAFNTQRVPVRDKKRNELPQILPFDSYSPLTADRRGRKIGGYGVFPDGTFYGCCACIGAAGAGVIPQMALMRRDGGIVINYYEAGEMQTLTPSGNALRLSVDTKYPYEGEIGMTVSLPKRERFAIELRIPAWCEGATLSVNGTPQTATAGYTELLREWQDGDRIELMLPMKVRQILPPEGAVNEEIFAAYRRGPIVLAADLRVTDPEAVLAVRCDADGRVAAHRAECPEIPEHKICFAVETEGGDEARLIDYASAGKPWNDSARIAAWIRRK